MRFCLLTTFYPPYSFGGDGVYVHRLAQALGEAGHEVDVIHSPDAYHLSNPGPPPLEFAELPNVTRHELRRPPGKLSTLLAHQTGGPALYAKQIHAVLDVGRHDVIHYHNVSLLGAPGVFFVGNGLKLMTCHEYWLVCPTHVLFRYNREACTRRTCFSCTLRARRPPQFWRRRGVVHRGPEQLDALIMSSQFALDRHREQGLSTNMELIPPFVPVPELSAIGPRTVAGKRPYFVYVGRLELLKGPHDAVEIFRGLEDVADLVIIGDGAMRDELRTRAADMSQVRFLSSVRHEQLSAIYRHATGVIVPSLCYETFGLTAAEAMAHGTPAIVRNHGALSEMIDQTGGGFSFATHDEARDAIRRLVFDPQFRNELGKRGRLHAENHWTRKRHFERYFALIDRLLARRCRSHARAGADSARGDA